MKKITLIVILCLLSNNFYGQRKFEEYVYRGLKDNSVFVGLWGNLETVLNINYERRLLSSKNEISNLFIRTGFAYHQAFYDNSDQLRFALEFNGVFGKKKKFLDLGLGYTPIFSNSDLTSPDIPEDQNGNYFYIYTVRLGIRIVVGPSYLRLSYLLTYRPITPKSSKLFLQKSFGMSVGIFF